MRRKTRQGITLLLAFLFLLSACGGGKQGTEDEAVSTESSFSEERGEDGSSAYSISDEGKFYQGVGVFTVGRKGPGQDPFGHKIWSFNQTYASILFDSIGRIVDISLDGLEVTSPNYDKAYSLIGTPAQSYYDGRTENGLLTADDKSWEEIFSQWKTRKGGGYNPTFPAGTWAGQVEIYENLFRGMTVQQVNDFADDYLSNWSGRPLHDQSRDPEDREKYEELSDQDKQTLADAVSGATISLSDSHGDFLGAINQAWENKEEVRVKGACRAGAGCAYNGWKGEAEKGEPQAAYGFNTAMAYLTLDEEGRILSLSLDEMTAASFRSKKDDKALAVFSGWPGQGKYSPREEDDPAPLDMINTEQSFFQAFEGWESEREKDRGRRRPGHFSQDAAVYAAFFRGMDREAFKQWTDRCLSDKSGKPLNPSSSDPADWEKYERLSPEEKASLKKLEKTDMSLQGEDGHFVEAILQAFDHSYALKEMPAHPVIIPEESTEEDIK